jgi:hypothetical protein
LKGLIEKKNNSSKKKKKIKEWGKNWEKITHLKSGLKDEIKNQ